MRLLVLAVLRIAAAAALAGGAATAAGCPATNTPNTLRILGGSPQTAQLGQQFQSSLQVALANANGCPLTGSLGGTAIRFVAPASGASGIFTTSGSSSVTVGTDANGTAVAPAYRANDTAGTYQVEAVSDYGSTTFTLTNTASGVAASLAATGPTQQLAFVNARYGQPLQVRVLDANGAPVQDVAVTFLLGTGSVGASASFVGGGSQATVQTDSSGLATSPAFAANGSPGRFTATASVAGLASAVTFGLDNRAAATSVAVDHRVLTARVQGRYMPLVAHVVGPDGQPVEGAAVTFSLPASTGAGAVFAGGATQATAVTDALGRAASPALVANGVAGRFSVTAAAPGAAAARYALRNLPGRPASITAGSASGGSTRVGTRFAIRPAVAVADANGNPVAGAVVTFATPARGPSARFGTRRVVRVRTDARGIAVAPALVANRKAGGYVVTASTGSAHPAAFALVNTP